MSPAFRGIFVPIGILFFTVKLVEHQRNRWQSHFLSRSIGKSPRPAVAATAVLCFSLLIIVNRLRSTTLTPETTWTVRGIRTLPKRSPRRSLQPRGPLIEGRAPAVRFTIQQQCRCTMARWGKRNRVGTICSVGVGTVQYGPQSKLAGTRGVDVVCL